MTKPFDFGGVAIDPVALGSQGNAVLGIRDSGKSYTATALAERLHDAGIPIMAFDPVGIWRFLRVPGRGRGYPIVVAGGLSADLALTPASAPAIARAAIENGVSVVFDFFDPELSKADWRRIVMSCLQVLLHENAGHGLRHVFIEEAAEFVPQRVIDGAVYAEVEKLARMGGNARLGYTLINQRAEEVNKAVLELCDNLFLHRQKGRNSLQNLGKWLSVGNVTDARPLLESLPTLPTGEAWAWLQGSDQPIRIQVPEKNSFHPDRRIMRGAAGVPAAAKPVDAAEFIAAMRAALASDPVASEIRAKKAGVAFGEGFNLGQALREAEDKGWNAGLAEGEARARAQLRDQLVDALPGQVRSFLHETFAAFGPLPNSAIGELASVGRIPELPAPAALARPPAELRPEPSAPRPAATPKPQAKAPPTAPIGELGAKGKILDVLAWWKRIGFDDTPKRQVCVMAGYSPNASTFGGYITELTGLGLVTTPTPGRLSITPAGEAHATPPAKVQKGRPVLDAARRMLSPAETKILDLIVEAHPSRISRGDLADQAGLSRTASTLGGYTTRLASFGFITGEPGFVRAADWLLVKVK